jgi:hypothetical protein
MSGRRRQGLSPSLFPFLAVLVCTLGTLILLLALVAQNATTAAQQQAQAKLQSKDEPSDAARPRMTRAAVEDLLRQEEFRVKELVSVRDQQTADLESRRDELTHLEDHIDRLRQQISQLNDEVGVATGELEATSITESAMNEIEAKINEEKRTIEELRERTNDHSPRVVIVPHKGPNGTSRRPVYLECHADGITIQPEGSRITLAQLENAGYSANPLDAALRTIRIHVMQTYGDPVPPYPLLVVRPDGIDSYGAARMAMRDWDDQFGYELVPAEVKLAYSKPDSNLKRRIDLAINHAVAGQRVRIAMSQRASNDGGLPGAAASREDRRSTRGSLPTLSAAALDQAGRANGFRSLRDDYRAPSTSSISGSPYARGPQIGSVNQNGYVGSASPSDDAGAAARRMAEQMQAAAKEMRAASPTGSLLGRHYADLAPGTESSEADPLATGTPQAAAEAGSSEPVSDGFEPGEAFTGDDPTRTAATERSSHSRPTPMESSSGPTGTERLPSSSARAGTAGESTAGSSSSQLSGAPSTSQHAQSMQTTPAMQSLDPMQGTPEAMASPSMTGSPVMMMDQQDLQDRIDLNDSMAPPQSPPPSSFQPPVTRRPDSELVRRVGRQWALPESVAGMGGNAIVRTIRLQCYPDRFVLLPAKNEGATEVFSFFNGDIERATLELATTLRDRIDQWGPALPGGRWQPRLEVQVKPRGQMRFHQLRTLMNDSGIEVVGRVSP